MINFQTSVLSVFVGHAKHLPFIGSQKTLPDSYVKTYILTPNRLLNKHFKRKTCVVKNTQNPTYNYQVKNTNKFYNILLFFLDYL